MQSSNTPSKIPLPFASGVDALKNTIPENSADAPNPNNASYQLGFPPITMLPIESGGLPFYGQDMNGILNALSSAARWANAGGSYKYDATFANDTNVGGYPKGAVLIKSGLSGFWFNTVENNTSNPDTGGAGWVDFSSILTNIPTQTSVAGLRTLPKTGPAFCFVSGYYTSGDGGGGMYYYDPADVTSSDNSGTIIVASDGGRWKLALIGPVSVKQFGAKGDFNGTTGTDDTAAIISALNSGAKWVHIPAGVYKITAGLSVPNYVTLSGDGYGAVPGAAATRIIKAGNFTGVTLNVASQLLNLSVEGDAGNGGDGVQLLGGRSIARAVSAFSHGRDGFKIGCYSTQSGANTNLWRCENIISRSNTRYGVFISHEYASASNANGGSIVGLDASNNGSHGINSENAFGNSIFTPTIQYNTGYAIRFNGDRNAVYGIYSEGNSAGYVLFDTAAQYNTVHTAITVNDGPGTVTDNSRYNSVYGGVDTPGTAYQRELYLSSKVTIDNGAISGKWEITKDGVSRNLSLLLTGTSGSADVIIGTSGTGAAGLRFGSTGAQVPLRDLINQSQSINFGTVGANSSSDATFTLTGATANYMLFVTPQFAVPTGITISVYWDGTNVKVRAANSTGAGVAVSGTIRVTGLRIA